MDTELRGAAVGRVTYKYQLAGQGPVVAILLCMDLPWAIARLAR